MQQTQDLPLRQFQQDYILASGYQYDRTDKHGTHIFLRGNECIHIIQRNEILLNEGAYLGYWRGDYFNSIGNILALDNILNFALALHAIGAINLKDNFRLAHEETAKAEFDF